MEKLLTFLQSIPEYKLLMQSVQKGECAAVTGVGQINRSHLAAGVFRDCERPVVIICQDDISAKRLSQELSEASAVELNGSGLFLLACAGAVAAGAALLLRRKK